MDITQYDIVISHHAFLRAIERMITPDMIEATIKSGKLKKFAKHNIKFIKPYKSFSVICIGEIKGMQIKIITIEKGEKK